MNESSPIKHDKNKDVLPKKNEKSEKPKELSRKEQIELLLESMSPREICSKIVLSGIIRSCLPNYSGESAELRSWKPHFVGYENGEQRVVFYEFNNMVPSMVPSLNPDALRPFLVEFPVLENIPTIEDFPSSKFPSKIMLPYVRFDKNGDFDPLRSRLYLLSKDQYDDLRIFLN